MARSTYHHGDLRRALVGAALVLVRAGGPSAVTLRGVARHLEVSPAAIYRHFPDREALLAEVGRIARQDLAQRMLTEVERVDTPTRRSRSVRRFLALGRGYLGFADEEPNLLAAAFYPVETLDGHGEQPNPWALLAAALDDLVASGAMPRERRPGAEAVAWSTVHGFAVLRAGRAFEVSGDPDPDGEAVLESIARALGITAI